MVVSVFFLILSFSLGFLVISFCIVLYFFIVCCILLRLKIIINVQEDYQLRLSLIKLVSRNKDLSQYAGQ